MEMAHLQNTSEKERLSQQATTEGKTNAKRRDWSEVAGQRNETLNLGPVDRTAILEHLISKVRRDMSERYSAMLEEHNVAEILEKALNPVVKDICEQGKFDLSG